jgi:hypothetical protein
MTFKEFRDKAEWIALAGAVIIFAGQWSTSVYYVDRELWVDRTPAVLSLLGFCATLLTLVLGLLTFPRWQSFVAIAACLWVTLMFWQGV